MYFPRNNDSIICSLGLFVLPVRNKKKLENEDESHHWLTISAHLYLPEEAGEKEILCNWGLKVTKRMRDKDAQMTFRKFRINTCSDEQKIVLNGTTKDAKNVCTNIQNKNMLLSASIWQKMRVNVDSWDNGDRQFVLVNPSLRVRVYFSYWIFVIIRKMMFTCSKLRMQHIKVTVWSCSPA